MTKASPKRTLRAASSGQTWIVTFADLMALLLTFFVLLLSVAEVDRQKYREMIQSIKGAFGVQWIQPLSEKPEGPEPGVVNLPVPDLPRPDLQQSLRSAMAEGTDPEHISVESDDERLVIRIDESIAFGVGSDIVSASLKPVLRKAAELLGPMAGTIVVAGHTDDIPIQTARFRSNWDLSAARAVSVVHELLASGKIDAARLVVQGHADTRPLVANDSAAHRAKNRRVEISVLKTPRSAVPSQEAERRPAAALSVD